jgi:hypothetical protein
MTVGITELPPEGMQLGGVALAGDAERGTKTTEGLSLLFTTAGITVQGPQPQIERLLVWSGLDSAACSEKTVLPDGRSAGVMELTSGGQTIRFLLPTETVTPGQAAYLDQALPAWLKRYKETSNAPLPPPPASAVHPPPAQPAQHVQTDGPVASPSSLEPTRPEPPVTQPAAATSPTTFSSAPPTDASPLPPPPTRTTGPVSTPATPPPPGATPLGTEPPPPATPPPPGATPLGTEPPPPATPPPPGATPLGTEPPPPATPPPPGATPLGTEPPPPATPPPAPGMPTLAPQPETASPGFTDPPKSPPSAPFRAGPTSPDLEPTPAVNGAEPALLDPPWDNPPVGLAVDSVTPTEKKGWRKSRTAATPPAASLPRPPAKPPKEQVPLLHSTLAPPSLEEPAPYLGVAATAGPNAPSTGAGPGVPVTDGVVTPGDGTKQGWRRKGKTAGTLATAATGAAVVASVDATKSAGDQTPGATTPDPALDTPSSPGGQWPASDGPDWALDPKTGTGDAQPATAPAAFRTPGPEDSPETDLPPNKGGDPVVAGSAPPKGNRSTVILLLVLLLVVIGGIAYFAVNRNKGTTTDNPLAPTPTVSPVAADSALAASVNLRLSDLPIAWGAVPANGQVARPPVAPAAAQVSAERNLATCIGGSYEQAAGLFGDSVLPGQTDSVRSPTFQSGSDTAFQMSSTTTVMGTGAEAQLLTTSFSSPNLATCLGQYQSALASAAIPGATAQVQMVTLPAPPGVSVLGYITTLTIPNQGSEVVGQAFLVAGRIETKLQPTTSGEAVPGDVFSPAYNAVAARVAAAANK